MNAKSEPLNSTERAYLARLARADIEANEVDRWGKRATATMEALVKKGLVRALDVNTGAERTDETPRDDVIYSLNE